jgi:hypothetical protein
MNRSNKPRVRLRRRLGSFYFRVGDSFLGFTTELSDDRRVERAFPCLLRELGLSGGSLCVPRSPRSWLLLGFASTEPRANSYHGIPWVMSRHVAR